MNQTSLPPSPAGLSIAEVERDTGIAKDTLRVWEKRYGFPQPLRTQGRVRTYPYEQVEQLRLIQRLLDAGLRPNKVVGLSQTAREQLAEEILEQPATAPVADPVIVATSDTTEELQSLLDAIRAHDAQTFRYLLCQKRMRTSLPRFIENVIAPLTVAVGDAWARGQFQIFEEHLFTEVTSDILRQTARSITPPAIKLGPTVLLTTLPEEPHGLGLLMVEAILTLEGCACISLGTKTPLDHIVLAAEAHKADIVALSFTDIHQGRSVIARLADLHKRLPAHTQIWTGGSCRALYQHALPGIQAVAQLNQLPQLVADWRAQQ